MVVTQEKGGVVRRLAALLLLVGGTLAWSQQTSKLSAKWEELTGPDFVQAIHQAQGVSLSPPGAARFHPDVAIGESCDRS